MGAPFYVTTPIYYPNAEPHIGSTYTTTYADALARYHRAAGRPAFFLTGTDEHGEKMAEAAEREGLEPKAFADRMAGRFRDTWDTLGISYDRFIRTTDADHVRAVRHFWGRIHAAGAIEFRDYTGRYCVGCERYLVDREIVDGVCEQHRVEPELRTEGNYFFQMSSHFDWLIDQLESSPELVTPERYRNEVLALLRSGALDELCITRPRERLAWGISAPWDEGFVIYVWIDALINYLTGAGYPDEQGWEERWSGVQHLIGKDILKPHAIFWPTMLRAADVPLYQGLHVHGFWNVDNQKISKSLGNLVHPLIMREKYGSDAFRYYLLREMSFGSDGEFSEQGVVRRINADLGNDLGNLLNRSVAMLHRYFEGVVPEAPEDAGVELADAAERVAAEVDRQMRAFSTQRALAGLWELIGAANKYIDARAPWQLARDPERRDELAAVLYASLEALRVIAVLLGPFLPETAARILESLGESPEPALESARWGGLRPGARARRIPALFPRVEAP